MERFGKMRRGMRSWLWLSLLLMSLVLIGCGAKSGQEKGTETVSQGKQEEKEAESKEKKKVGKVEGFTEKELELLCGEWTVVCGTFRYEEDGQIDESFAMSDEEEGVGRDLFIYTEDGKLYADYRSMSVEYYHLPLQRKKEALYEGYKGENWCLVGEKGRWEDSDLRFGVNQDQEMTQYSSGVDEGKWTYESLYLKQGSEKLKHAEDYRYSKTVTVSTAEEFAAAIGNRTKIILKPGEYDLTELGKEGEQGFTLSDVSNLCIMAESNALTELYITDSVRPVLPISSGNNILLDGITLGHRVEPGTCSGSVIYAEYGNRITIKDCRLYGSGSYGFETDKSNDITLKGTEIYDCTYGIMDLRDSYMIEAEQCDFHDNHGFEMLDLMNSAGIRFKACKFRNNGGEDHVFLTMRESWNVEFYDSQFEGNIYPLFHNSITNDGQPMDNEPVIENCTFNEKEDHAFG